MLSKKNFGSPKKWPLGSENGHFWPKTSSFGQKWRFLAVQKFSKKFFSFFLHFRPFPIVFYENKKNWPPLAPFLPLFGPAWPHCPTFGKPDHIHWTMVMWYLFWKHSMSRNGRTTFKNFWTPKNIHSGKNTMLLAPNLDFRSPWPHTLWYGGIW